MLRQNGAQVVQSNKEGRFEVTNKTARWGSHTGGQERADDKARRLAGGHAIKENKSKYKDYMIAVRKLISANNTRLTTIKSR